MSPILLAISPNNTVMPGVLIIRSNGADGRRAGCVTFAWSAGSSSGWSISWPIDKGAISPSRVHPGVIIRLPVKVIRHRGPVWRFEGKAFVDDELCAEAEYSAMLTEQSIRPGAEPLPEP